MDSQGLGGLAGQAPQGMPGAGGLTDMAGGQPPTAQNPGGSNPLFDKAMYGYDMVTAAIEQLGNLERELGDDPAEAKLKSMAATIRSMRAAKMEKVKKLQTAAQGAMLGVGR